MDKILAKTQIVKDAVKAQKGLNWALEILIFVAVFFVAQISMGIVTVPVTVVVLFSNSDYINAAVTGDINIIMDIVTELLSDDLYSIVMLFSNIIMIVIACLFCRFIQKRKLTNIGFCKNGAVKSYVIGAVIGFAMFSLAVLFSVLTGGLTIDGISDSISVGMILIFLLGYVFQGMAEEVLCRGYFMVSYARRYSMLSAVIINSVVFGALHLLNSGITVLSFINLVLFGIFASLYYLRSGNLWGVGALHTVWNFVQGNIYGIKVSGMRIGQSVFTTTVNEGKDLLSGGNFGLEGSLPVTVVLCIGIAILFIWKKKDNVHENVTTQEV